jgi:putative SOS response-associated peptidase YedK
MCARFTLAVPDLASLARMLAAVDVDPALEAVYRPRYNVAPSGVHAVLRARDGRRELIPATFGLASRWGADPRVPLGGSRLVNARSESARTKPAFRGAFARRRCVVPADGFFEWTGVKGARRPLWFSPRAGGLLHLAGLYELPWDPATGEAAPAFAILTTAASGAVATVHDRMPAILDPADLDVWLDVHGSAGPERAEALLRPAPPGLLEGRAVSVRVNSVVNDDASLLRPEPEGGGAQGTLPLFDMTEGQSGPAAPRPRAPGRRRRD